VIGVSADAQETNDAFRKTLDLPYLLVGDPGGKIRGAYGVKWPIFGLAQRVTYVIGRDTRIRLAFWSELDVDAHTRRACAALNAPSAF